MSTETFSDYGSGSSISSFKSWASQDTEEWSKQSKQAAGPPPMQKTTSFLDLVLGRCSLEDAMREFRLNGSDSPYNPEEEFNSKRVSAPAAPSYRRQTSWPAPELTPTQPLPHQPVQPPTALLQPALPHATTLFQPATQAPPLLQSVTSTQPKILQPPTGLPTTIWSGNKLPANVGNVLPETLSQESNLRADAWTDVMGYEETFQINEPAPTFSTSTPIHIEELTTEQKRVLSSLSDDAVYTLLKELEMARGGDIFEKRKKRHNTECRFCKNNGERESYYRSHSLKDAQGRVKCPVLRRYRCSRCLATGDDAHTAKYCPLTTADERVKSCAMMRSVRLSSGRHRRAAAPAAQYVVFGETPQAVVADTMVSLPTLHHDWAMLEHKLMM